MLISVGAIIRLILIDLTVNDCKLILGNNSSERKGHKIENVYALADHIDVPEMDDCV